MSRARPLAVSYLRDRSFSSDFITIQSRSPRTQPRQLRRLQASPGGDRGQEPEPLSLVLGFFGSSSLISRTISCQAASLNRCRSSGVVPVNSSYRITPERIDVAARIDVEVIELGLLGAHVQGRADHDPVRRVQRAVP